MSVHLFARLFTVLSFLAFCAAAMAQPFQQGCHYFRSHPSTTPQPTPAQRALIDEVIARSDTFDIVHYDIAIDVTDQGGQRIKAATTIEFIPLMADQSFIRFELWGLDVDSVTVPGGSPLTFTHDGQLLRVNLGQPPEVGELRELTVHYQGQPHRDPQWGGFYFESGYIYNLGIGLSTIPPNFGKVWYPCFDSFVERATYTYHVKSVLPMKAHCQGVMIAEEQLEGDTVVRSFNFDKPIPTHLSAIAVADYRDTNYVHEGVYGDVPVRLTAKAPQLPAMVEKFTDLGGAIDACEFWYGPYAWGRVGYVLTTDGALEIPNNIAYPDFMPSQSIARNRTLLAHELGHHWWGNMVTPRTQQDMWLKEGPAEYSAHLTQEWINGHEAFMNVVNDNQLSVLRDAHLQDDGFQPLSPMPDPQVYGPTTYYKGASAMHNLRGYLGDTLFRQGLRAVQVEHAYETLDAAGFRDALEASTGQDLHPFFDNEVFAPGFSVFVVQELQAEPVGNQWQVSLQMKQKLRGSDSFRQQVPMDITLVGAQGQRQEYSAMGSGEFTSVELTCDFAPEMAILNGHGRLNQARMAHERLLLPGESVPMAQPRVDFRLFVDELPDTALIRIEHIWAAPEDDALGAGIDEISDTHYWIVDGIWPEGTQLRARLNYSAALPSSLDHELLGTDETGVMLLYRATATDPWEPYAFQDIQANLPTNAIGYINLEVLLRGQYAFGKGMFVGLEEPLSTEPELKLWPVPTAGQLMVEGLAGTLGDVVCNVYDMRGRLVLSVQRMAVARGTCLLDVSGLPAGNYLLQVNDREGSAVGSAPFVVER